MCKSYGHKEAQTLFYLASYQSNQMPKKLTPFEPAVRVFDTNSIFKKTKQNIFYLPLFITNSLTSLPLYQRSFTYMEVNEGKMYTRSFK